MTDPVYRTPPSPKVILGGVGALLLPVALTGVGALVAEVASKPELLSDIPWWVKVPLLAMAASVGSVIAGYRTRDVVRDVGAETMAGRGIPVYGPNDLAKRERQADIARWLAAETEGGEQTEPYPGVGALPPEH